MSSFHLQIVTPDGLFYDGQAESLNLRAAQGGLTILPCEDILAQINAAKSALHGCGKVVLEGHIKHCVRDGIEHGDADKTIENFTKAVERFSNMG